MYIRINEKANQTAVYNTPLTPMGAEEQQTEDSGDLSDEEDVVESEGGQNIDLMKLDTKENPKQKKFRLLDPREVPATKEEWRTTDCSTDG